MVNKKYEKLMAKCISLAKKSEGKNLPNPYVGAIIYDEKNDKIISTGYHELFGSNHAEVNAINNAKGNTKGKTLIVNLEPCSHFGKTPPCCDLIIKSGIKKVVYAMDDVNPKVKGKEILKKAKIEVISGVYKEKALELNKVFIKNQFTKKPYIMLKVASTLDSKIALSNGKSKWITNEKSRHIVQKLRSNYQAIMTGSGTVLSDNPNLNVRLKNKNSPIRIIFDPNGKLSLKENVFKDDGIRIILISNKKRNCAFEQIEFKDFDSLLKELFKKGICSIMVESGAGLNSALLKAGEVDEINYFIAPKIFGGGLDFIKGFDLNEISSAIELYNVKIKKIDDDILINAKIKKENSIWNFL